MKKLIGILIAISFAVSCKEKQTYTLQDESAALCSCFSNTKTNLNNSIQDLLKKVALDTSKVTAKAILTKEAQNLPFEEGESFNNFLINLTNKNSDLWGYISNFERKHKETNPTEKALILDQLILDMQKNKDCFISVALLKLSKQY